MKNERQIYKKICIQNFKNHPKNIVLKQQHSFNKNSKNKNILPNKQKAQLLLITNNNILYEKTSFSSCSSNTERVKLCSSHQNLSVNSINNSIKRSYMLSNKKRVIKIPTAKEKTLSKMLDKIIEMNPELTKKQLQEKLGNQYEKEKERRVASKKDIEKIFRKYMDKYFEKINEISI